MSDQYVKDLQKALGEFEDLISDLLPHLTNDFDSKFSALEGEIENIINEYEEVLETKGELEDLLQENDIDYTL